MTAYRFCRTDDMGLLVEAYERCRGPEDEGEPPLDRAAFKGLVRSLDLWCSSCMVAFDGRDPVGVLLGAKRPESTLVHTLRVHPGHRRQGHGRHLLTSLGQKLAILGPPRLVAEIPAERAAAASAFGACGWKLEERLIDWHRPAGAGSSLPMPDAANVVSEALTPVTFSDLDSAGLVGEGVRCWERDRPALAKAQERLSGLAFQSMDRIEAWALWTEMDERSEQGEASATVAPAESGGAGALRLLAFGAVPGALGRLGLGAIVGELSRLSGGAPFLLSRVSSEEIEPGRLEELGFERGAEHLLFGTRAQAA